mgnify:CR=1 FL=1
MDYKIKLTKPFKFEDETYTEIDLSAGNDARSEANLRW